MVGPPVKPPPTEWVKWVWVPFYPLHPGAPPFMWVEAYLIEKEVAPQFLKKVTLISFT
jgi:hypothetical protein